MPDRRCSTANPGILPPPAVGQVSALRFGATGLTLSWSPTPGADSYTVVRGTLDILATGSHGDCLADGVTAIAFDDPGVPAASTGLFYLIRGDSEDCGPGLLGYDSSEQPRADPGPGAC